LLNSNGRVRGRGLSGLARVSAAWGIAAAVGTGSAYLDGRAEWERFTSCARFNGQMLVRLVQAGIAG